MWTPLWLDWECGWRAWPTCGAGRGVPGELSMTFRNHAPEKSSQWMLAASSRGCDCTELVLGMMVKFAISVRVFVVVWSGVTSSMYTFALDSGMRSHAQATKHVKTHRSTWPGHEQQYAVSSDGVMQEARSCPGQKVALVAGRICWASLLQEGSHGSLHVMLPRSKDERYARPCSPLRAKKGRALPCIFVL